VDSGAGPLAERTDLLIKLLLKLLAVLRALDRAEA
jgi:hypothetical protein